MITLCSGGTWTFCMYDGWDMVVDFNGRDIYIHVLGF